MRQDIAKLKELHKNINLELLLLNLSENFENIYYIDFENNFIVPYRLNEVIESNYGEFFKSYPTYGAAITAYINSTVSRKDQGDMLRVCKESFIKEQLRTRRAFSHEFRVFRDGRDIYFRMKIASLDPNGEPQHAVMGFANITHEKTVEKDFYKANRTVLIVENDEESNQVLADVLKSDYAVLQAFDGEEALAILEKRCDEIAMVITNLEMPKLDGYELIKTMNGVRQYNRIPIIVATASKSADVEVECLELGAADFILKPYNPDVIRNRVKCLIRLQESTAMLNTLEKDKLTGLYTKDFFYQHVEEILDQNSNEDYMLVVSDLENFKMVNEKYGIKTGDDVLRIIANNMMVSMPGFVIGGRLNSDRFVFLQKARKLSNEEGLYYTGLYLKDTPVPNLTIKFGIFHVVKNMSVQAMADRAALALQQIKGVYGTIYAEYDDKLRKDLVVQQQILDNMAEALEKHQFSVYLQPKHNLHDDKTGGAEALVRWIHPELGFMNPGIFIPLFEQNGFIQELDFYVWEEVCKTLHRWKQEGKPLIPISVNVSRRDFELKDLAKFIFWMVDSYEIPHEYIHIEVTESAFTDNPEQITQIVKELHEAGFVIELDDFGVGYSSLTTLNSMDLDIIKLDMSIIRNDEPGSARNVLEFSMELAKMLKLKTVAEGVETEEKVERLKCLGCDYIQGYYYSKPLPIEEFESYMEQTI